MCLIYCNQGLAGLIPGAVLAPWTLGSVPGESPGVGGTLSHKIDGGGMEHSKELRGHQRRFGFSAIARMIE